MGQRQLSTTDGVTETAPSPDSTRRSTWSAAAERAFFARPASTRRLAREEGLFAGTSSGANVVAALWLAELLGPEAKIVMLMADSGLKYLNTDVYGASATSVDPVSHRA